MSLIIETTALDGLRANFAGELIQPQDAGFDAARQIWNGHVQRRPALIARCRGVADVIAAVRFCREHDLPASVRGGGHAVAGHAICDGGVVIDLSAMTGSRVDPVARTIRARRRLPERSISTGRARRSGSRRPVGSSATPGSVASPWAEGSATSCASSGWRSTPSAPVMSSPPMASSSSPANRRTRSCSGAYGAAAATSASSRTSCSSCSRSARSVLAGMVAWPMDEAPEMLRFLREFIAEAPDEVGLMANLRLAPPLPVVPEELWGKPIVALDCDYAGPIEKGRDALAPIHGLPHPGVRCADAEAVRRAPEDVRCGAAARPALLLEVAQARPLTDEIIDVVVDHAAQVTSPLSTVPIFCFGGAVARVPRSQRPSPTVTPPTTSTSWRRGFPTTADDADRHIEWVRGFFDALEPYSRGVYVNFTSDDASERVRVRPTRRTVATARSTAQGQVRPDELLPDERQHPAHRFVAQPLRGSRVSCMGGGPSRPGRGKRWA